MLCLLARASGGLGVKTKGSLVVERVAQFLSSLAFSRFFCFFHPLVFHGLNGGARIIKYPVNNDASTS